MALERRLAKLEAARGRGLVLVVTEAAVDASGAPLRNPVAALTDAATPALDRAPGETPEGFRARIRASFGPRAALVEIDRRDMAL